MYDAPMLATLLATMALGIACAALSVLVVSRRWAFLGEGIAHAAFGGAGTAWVLALIWPALDQHATPFIAIPGFCLAAGIAIGAIQRRQRVNSDAAIGIFLVASLAWGFLAQSLYTNAHHGVRPPAWDTILMGQAGELSGPFANMTTISSAAILLVLFLLRKEILSYCLDPVMAEVSGVAVSFIHYLLIVLLTLTIIMGIRVAGSLLVTALLILPGATALLVARRLFPAIGLAVVFSVVASVGGPLLHQQWNFLPQGPMIVLTLFAQFVVVYGWSSVARRA
jgi:ABC-type Mn2+/Zn2+ transport system permease subunit